MKKILCILENAYVDNEDEIEEVTAPYFKPNIYSNRSGKRMAYITAGHDMYFTNACPEAMSNPNDKGKTDIKRLKKNIKKQSYDLYIVCGVQAKEAINEILSDINKPLLFMPHPTSRTLSSNTIEAVREYVIKGNYKRIYMIKQLPKKKFKVSWSNKISN